jgi:hypothetical protein
MVAPLFVEYLDDCASVEPVIDQIAPAEGEITQP